jgi:hypothetical protein
MQMGLLTALSGAFDLSSNALTGRIPSQIGSLTGLTLLDLSNNRLNGTIPNQVAILCANLNAKSPGSCTLVEGNEITTPSPTISPAPTTKPTHTHLPTVTPFPSAVPAPEPTPEPTSIPLPLPTPEPSSIPSQLPEPKPTPAPTFVPSPLPTLKPSPEPTTIPSTLPTLPPGQSSDSVIVVALVGVLLAGAGGIALCVLRAIGRPVERAGVDPAKFSRDGYVAFGAFPDWTGGSHQHSRNDRGEGGGGYKSYPEEGDASSHRGSDFDSTMLPGAFGHDLKAFLIRLQDLNLEKKPFAAGGGGQVDCTLHFYPFMIYAMTSYFEVHFVNLLCVCVCV